MDDRVGEGRSRKESGNEEEINFSLANRALPLRFQSCHHCYHRVVARFCTNIGLELIR